MPRIAYWLTAALVALLVFLKYEPGTGFTSLIHFGASRVADSLPGRQGIPVAAKAGSSGYDGQFYAQIALDPTLRTPALEAALDAPSYRARRILVPGTAYVLGLGESVLILQVYALLNAVCWAGFAFLLQREIGAHDTKAFARWLACVLSLGVLDSVRQSLVDLPALLLLLLSLRAAKSSRPALAAGWAALGHLAKETNVLASLALAAAPGQRPKRMVWLSASLAPLVAWLAYVATRFPSGESGLGNFTWPLVGAFEQFATSLGHLSKGNWDSRHLFAALTIPGLFLQATALCTFRQPGSPWWRIGIAYAGLLLFLGPWVWSGYWAACRAVLPLTIAFNVLLPPCRVFWPLLIAGNLSVLHAVWRFL